MTTIKIEDIEVELEECGHCGLLPTEADAVKAVQAVRKNYGPCPSCGLKVDIKSITLHHANRTGKKGESFWKPSCVELKDAIHMDLRGYKRNCIHSTCVERVFGNRIERGEVWRPWDEESTFTVTGS